MLIVESRAAKYLSGLTPTSLQRFRRLIRNLGWCGRVSTDVTQKVPPPVAKFCPSNPIESQSQFPNGRLELAFLSIVLFPICSTLEGGKSLISTDLLHPCVLSILCILYSILHPSFVSPLIRHLSPTGRTEPQK